MTASSPNPSGNEASNLYALLLRDPRWQKKRLLIFQRDAFACQICGCTTEELHVHHFFYQKTRAPWEYPDSSLQTRCAKCHKIGHSLVDGGLKFYLAGKVGHTDWRHEIVTGLRSFPHNPAEDDFWLQIQRGIAGVHHYVGPFFLSCDHGCSHVAGWHGCHVNNCTSESQPYETLQAYWGGKGADGRTIAFKNAMIGIEKCDVFFAWIESYSCFGTLAEIGYAYALGKLIWISFAEKPMDDLWFAARMDTFHHPDKPRVDKTAKDAFEALLCKLDGPVRKPAHCQEK